MNLKNYHLHCTQGTDTYGQDWDWIRGVHSGKAQTGGVYVQAWT